MQYPSTAAVVAATPIPAPVVVAAAPARALSEILLSQPSAVASWTTSSAAHGHPSKEVLASLNGPDQPTTAKKPSRLTSIINSARKKGTSDIKG
jgi:hypothetical protein